jgi:hypothetical protein
VNAKEEVAEILQTLSESVKRHTRGSLQADGSFKTAVRAALAKNYELNQIISAQDDFKPSIEKLIGVLDQEDRWPELVTHEEMNQPEIAGPRYVLGRMLRTEGATSAIWKWI